MIELEEINRVYKSGSKDLYALRDINLTFEDGEFTIIKGPSGSGKSTLLNVISCLDRPTSGTYRLNGAEVTAMEESELVQIRRNTFGMIFQAFHLVSRMTAVRNVELPMIFAGISPGERRERAKKYLESVGLGDRIEHRPDQLSGGERQRVAVARALVLDPDILLADEPTGNLDTESGNAILNLLQDLNRKGRTVLIVSHDPEIARRGRRVVSLRDGEVEKDERS